MTETFKKSWRGIVRSSDGYSFRIAGQVGIDYEDALGRLRIDSEVTAGPGLEIVVYVDRMPEAPGRPRRLVIQRLQRAAEFAGWTLDLRDTGGPLTGDIAEH